jgi:hypothetical protein
VAAGKRCGARRTPSQAKRSRSGNPKPEAMPDPQLRRTITVTAPNGTTGKDPLRTAFAVAADLVLNGHVHRSRAYNIEVTQYGVKLQGSDSDAMAFVARDLGIAPSHFLAANGFHKWTGSRHGVQIDLASSGRLTAPATEHGDVAAIETLAAEVTS